MAAKGAATRQTAGKMKGRTRRWLAGLLLTAGCAAFFEAPSVSIVGVRVVSLGLTGGTAALELQVANPNSHPIRITGVEYHLLVQEPDSTQEAWTTLSRGDRREAVTLPARDSARVSLDVPFEYRSVGTVVRTLLQSGRLPYRLEGQVRVEGPVGELRVPLRTTGVLEP